MRATVLFAQLMLILLGAVVLEWISSALLGRGLMFPFFSIRHWGRSLLLSKVAIEIREIVESTSKSDFGDRIFSVDKLDAGGADAFPDDEVLKPLSGFIVEKATERRRSHPRDFCCFRQSDLLSDVLVDIVEKAFQALYFDCMRGLYTRGACYPLEVLIVGLCERTDDFKKVDHAAHRFGFDNR